MELIIRYWVSKYKGSYVSKKTKKKKSYTNVENNNYLYN